MFNIQHFGCWDKYLSFLKPQNNNDMFKKIVGFDKYKLLKLRSRSEKKVTNGKC